MINYEQVKEQMEKYGYVATEELVWEAVKLLDQYSSDGKERKGQDISAVCLEGPPGAGKTEFAKVMLKLTRDLVNKDCAMIEYQCDPTTGKGELFEDISAVAAIAGEPEKVIIDGALLKAIDAVNAGKKVILFIDEYDKAREETDSFFLQFLQSGKISTTQKESAKILKQSDKKNLKVILCKNNNREQLSGPLERRLQFIRLEEMNPTVFFKVANNKFPENKELVNFVTIIYELLFNNKDKFTRIPSCSEMLTAIEDAMFFESHNAPNRIVYKSIFNNMMKDKESEPLFYELLKKAKDKVGLDLCEILKKSDDKSVPTIRQLITKAYMGEYKKKFDEKIKEIESLKEKYLNGSNVKVNDNLALENKGAILSVEDNFDDQNGVLQRGQNVFSGSENWNKIVQVEFNAKDLDEKKYLKTMIDNFSVSHEDSLSFAIYENGFRVNYDNNTYRLNIVRTKSGETQTIEFYTDNVVVPAFVFDRIGCIIHDVKDCCNNKDANVKVEALIYNKGKIKDSEMVFGDVYHYSYQGEGLMDSVKSIATDIVAPSTEWTTEDIKRVQSQMFSESEQN